MVHGHDAPLVSGVAWLEAVEAALGPAALLAVMVKVYVVPFVKL
jgi:hypothetical protein